MPAQRSSSGFTNPSYSFFTLPLELRRKVYAFLMNDANIDCNGEAHGSIIANAGREEPSHLRFRVKELSSQLLRTSSVVHAEAIEVLYTGRTITTNDCDSIGLDLLELGVLACSFLRKIAFTSRKLPGIDDRSSIKCAPLPPLPSLRSVSYRFLVMYRTSFKVPYLQYIERLEKVMLQAQKSEGNELERSIEAVGPRTNATWHIEILVLEKERWLWYMPEMIEETGFSFDIGFRTGGSQKAHIRELWMIADSWTGIENFISSRNRM